MSQVSANYMEPAILNSLAATAKQANSKSGTARAQATPSSGSSSSSSSSTDLSTTFMTLLAQELENQDPTAPVDPTEMVGQMISLNQLEQLISINQAITGDTSSDSNSSTQSSAQTSQSTANAAQSAVGAALANEMNGSASKSSPWAAAAATNQLPFDPNTMMPVASTNSSAASINSSINPTMMGFSGTNNNSTKGGK